MAKEWYLMDSPPIFNGGYEGEEWENYARQGFQEMLDTTMLCDHVEFINSDFSVIVPGKAVIQSVTENTAIKMEDRQILAPIGTLSRYAYVRFNGVVWLIDSEPSNNKFYEKAPLKLCNNQLRWQDPKTKKILEYWYWCEDVTRYGTGLYEGNVVVTFDKQYVLHLPHDPNTNMLHDGMRFMLEKSGGIPLVYKLTKFDGITGNNQNVKILKITLSSTVYDDQVDNAELMIADYYERKPQDHVEHSEEYDCRIDFESDQIMLSSSEEYKAVFFDKWKNKVDVDFHWTITDNDFDVDKLKLSEDGDTVKISVKNDKSMIGKSFRLNVALSNDAVVASVEVKIIPLW